MTDREVVPFDGTAEVLHLIEAARALAATAGDVDRRTDPAALAVIGWAQALEARYAREQPAPDPVGWEPRRWRELVAGDTVEAGGVETEVLAASTQRWHVDPNSNEYRPTPLEHDVTVVTLAFRPDQPYRMPPDGEVECLRGPAGQAVDEANGHRSLLSQEPIDVMASWAADAALTLEAAGLGPAEVIG